MFRRSHIVEAKRFAISEGQTQPSTTGALDVGARLSCLTADQKPVFFLPAKDLASFSRVSWFCLRFSRLTED